MARASGNILIKVEGNGAAGLSSLGTRLSAAGTTFEIEPLFEVPASAAGPGVGAKGRPAARWHLARSARAAAESPWDSVRDVRRQAAAKGAKVTQAEPDLIQDWPVDSKSASGIGVDSNHFSDQSGDGGRAVVPGVFAWHLGDDFSGLRTARADARQNKTADIRIAHLDVGYGLDHDIFPRDRFDPLLSKNCSGDGRPERDVIDEVKRGSLRNPGHGMGTLGILAGGHFEFHGSGYDFAEELGAAIDATIVGIRVGDSVVQFSTSSVARAIAYVADLCKDESTRIHVLSMSMGGVASDAWADAVNLAYERGVVLVTAAGNNYSTKPFGGVPTTSTIYPARFERVLAACGIMGNLQPYYGLDRGTMQGNWGPKSKRESSLAAFTPNTSWARRSDKDVVDMDGSGTSSATPQIAGAAALYLQRHGDTVFKYPEPWMRVEAVRHALKTSARADFGKDAMEKLGSGMLRAQDALNIAPPPQSVLKPSEKAKASFAFLRAFTGLGAKADVLEDPMLELELAQLVQQWEDGPNPFDDLILKADEQPNGLTPSQQLDLFEKLRSHPRASAHARKALGGSLQGGPGGSVGPGGARGNVPPPVFSTPVKFEPQQPKFLELRGYALDPSFATSLATRKVSETVYRVPWDEKIAAGPSDDYIEVMDVDPASRFVYEPVDLRHPNLLASRGLAPSEGTPQFHQQMVYAVARLTIENFEKALGRPALWRPGPPPPGRSEKDDSVYVPQLRIYPHALREANAYYSPEKIALLFGYFNSQADDGDSNRPREQVFTCLSQDVIAHETTHALLDGMHRKYLTDSNPDVLAFHEAFADIVALFQRLTLPELLKHQIASTRGQIRTRRSLLGELATQFGQATGERGGLREAIGAFDVDGKWVPAEPKDTEYEQHAEPHARGSVLVAAVFDAFMSIYEKRTEDLVRIATGGTGELLPGAIHPDLVARLADEATKAASHVLRMCIRALDYCPPTDITFGEYLRAIITADHEIVPDDDLEYRIAFVEAFRKRGIAVREVRTLSIESLLWRDESEQQRLSKDLCEKLGRVHPVAVAHAFTRDRKTIFTQQRRIRAHVHGVLKTHFGSHDEGPADARVLGLSPSLSFEVHSVRFAIRVGPDGQMLSQAIISVLQDDAQRSVGEIPFEGGCTIIADLSNRQVKYIIRKNVTSETRLDQQRAYARQAAMRGERSAYFRSDAKEPFAALHLAKGGH